LITLEEVAKVTEYGHSMNLVRMQQRIEYFLGHMDGISDHNDFGNIFLDIGLVNTVPGHKEFSFSACDKGRMM